MSIASTSSAYQETEVLSSSSERLVPLLYKRLLVSLKRGATFIRKGDIDGKHESLDRAQDILAELLASLDFDAGGEIAEQLSGLYLFWSKEISGASLRLEAEPLDRVGEMVATLYESWEEAARLSRSTDSGEAQSATS